MIRTLACVGCRNGTPRCRQPARPTSTAPRRTAPSFAAGMCRYPSFACLPPHTRSVHDLHMPNASAPHIMCDATNLTVAPSAMTRAACPLHRPGYMCRRQSYHRYAQGSFIAPCDWPSFRLEDFPRDHLRDVFGGFHMPKEGEAVPTPLAVMELPVLLVTRESQEYTNVFHTFTDVLNAFITMRMLGWEQRPRLVVLLDAHPPGPLDGLWAGVVAGGGRDGAKDPWGATTTGEVVGIVDLTRMHQHACLRLHHSSARR